MRRISLAIILAIELLVISASSAIAQSEIQSPVDRVNLIKQVAEAIKVAGEALAMLGDHIAHIVGLGATGYDEVVRRIERSERIDLVARMAETRGSNEIVLQTFADYLKYTAREKDCPHTGLQWGPTWSEVKTTTGRILLNVSNLLKDVHSLRGDVVNEAAYQKLVITLINREQVLARFSNLEEPCSKEELEALRLAATRYRTYVEQLDSVRKSIAEYNRRFERKSGD